jgi:uncharacterized membrane protein YfcA
MQRLRNAMLVLHNDSPRRLRVWAAMVAGVAVLLVLNALMPHGLWPDAKVAQALPRAAILVFLVALACEYLDSSLGMGYGTTLTPILLLAGFAPLDIVPAILLSEALTGAAAGLLHQRDGNVNFLRDARARRTATLLIALSAAGAIAAATLAVKVSKESLTLFIASIIIAMGVIILLTIKCPFRYRPGGIVAIGAVAAFNKGLSGGGYGPLVTAGQVVSGLPSKHAIAITSVAESFTCVVGLAAYLGLGRAIHWGLTIPLVTGALLSVPIATLTVRRLPERGLRLIVGLVTLALGALALSAVLK